MSLSGDPYQPILCYGLDKCWIDGEPQIPCETPFEMPLATCLKHGGHIWEGPDDPVVTDPDPPTDPDPEEPPPHGSFPVPLVQCYDLPQCMWLEDSGIYHSRRPCPGPVQMDAQTCLQRGGNLGLGPFEWPGEEDPDNPPLDPPVEPEEPASDEPCLEEVIEYQEHWYPNMTVMFWISFALAVAFV